MWKSDTVAKMRSRNLRTHLDRRREDVRPAFASSDGVDGSWMQDKCEIGGPRQYFARTARIIFLQKRKEPLEHIFTHLKTWILRHAGLCTIGSLPFFCGFQSRALIHNRAAATTSNSFWAGPWTSATGHTKVPSGGPIYFPVFFFFLEPLFCPVRYFYTELSRRKLSK
jgi:hypothetical protein